ncbi:AraC family transcriptional regulator [Litoribrevibacter albus]|uniref:Transcriptional regulator n=1 Tax=Litoribrevibacter albus TaxID=1473156 RepID=A0AA37SE04_9GAMM|nr:AraC family transcriptional regulator [Litoribrevibacter albus]GLQ33586.1 transcriptional regulator [Litoribrevibacter albus]
MAKQQSVIKSYVQTLIDTTINAGVTLSDLLDELPLSEDDLKQPEFRLDMTVMTQLWLRAVALTKDPYLGLHVGENMQLGSLHAFGPIAMNCPTLDTAIDYMVKYSSIVSEGGVISYKHQGELCNILYTPNENLIPVTHYQIEGVLSTLINIARMISTESLTPTSVHFEHDEPDSLDVYHRIFRCPIYFNATDNKIVLTQQDVALPVKFADPSLLAFHEILAQQILTKLSKEEKTRHHVQHIIHELGPRVCSPENVAQRLNLSLRSLQRKLQEEHSSYQDILDTYRKEQSKHLLTHTQWSIATIAEHLGYLNLSSYHRAFRRWYGITPAGYRKEKIA